MDKKKSSLGLSLTLGMIALLGVIVVRSQMRPAAKGPAGETPAVEAPEPPPAAPDTSIHNDAEPARQTIPEVVPHALSNEAPRTPATGEFPFAKLNPKIIPADQAGVVIEHREPEKKESLPVGEAALPEDLRKQLEAEPPELPEDMKAQLGTQPEPKELPDDIQRAMKMAPRIVTLDEVNNPANATVTETK